MIIIQYQNEKKLLLKNRLDRKNSRITSKEFIWNGAQTSFTDILFRIFK